MPAVLAPTAKPWKTQPRHGDGQWGERPRAAVPRLSHPTPDYQVLRSKGRLYIDGITVHLKHSTERGYHHDAPWTTIAALSQDYESTQRQVDFWVDRLNAGTLRIDDLAAARRLLRAFTTHHEARRLSYPRDVPARIHPAGIIASWLARGTVDNRDWKRGNHILFGDGHKTDKPLRFHVDTDDASEWRWSTVDSEGVGEAVDAIADRLREHRQNLNLSTHPYDSQTSRTAYKMASLQFAIRAIGVWRKRSALSVPPERAERWLSVAAGPFPYVCDNCDSAGVEQILSLMTSSEQLEELLERLLVGERYGSAFTQNVLYAVGKHPNVSARGADLAWQLYLQGDRPPHVAGAARYFGAPHWQGGLRPPRTTDPARAWSQTHDASKRTLTEVVSHWKTFCCSAQTDPDVANPPSLQAARAAHQKAQDAYRRQMLADMPDGVMLV